MKFEGFHNDGFKLTAEKKSSGVTCFSAVNVQSAAEKSEGF